jgi:hypothetical protein
MKQYFLFLLCIPVVVQAQTIKNNGFEKSGVAARIAEDWNIRIGDAYGKETDVLPKGYASSLDKLSRHRGKQSLMMNVPIVTTL